MKIEEQIIQRPIEKEQKLKVRYQNGQLKKDKNRRSCKWDNSNRRERQTIVYKIIQRKLKIDIPLAKKTNRK
jgi:hypothetical protein